MFNWCVDTSAQEFREFVTCVTVDTEGNGIGKKPIEYSSFFILWDRTNKHIRCYSYLLVQKMVPYNIMCIYKLPRFNFILKKCFVLLYILHISGLCDSIYCGDVNPF